MKKKRRELLFLYVAAVAVLIVLIYGLPQVTGALTSTYTVKYGRLRIYDSADGYIVRTEEVYRAGSGGTENRYIRDGKLIRKGTKILEMTGSGSSSEDRDSAYEDLLDRLNGKAKETDSYRTDTEGVVSYTADGYEYVLTPENMTKKSRSFYVLLIAGAAVLRERSLFLFPVRSCLRLPLRCRLPCTSLPG